MMELLFHTPWWLPTLLIGVGVALFISGNARREMRVRAVGMLCVAAALALMTVSYLVDTPLEKAVKQSKALVRAVEKRDWNTVQTILSPRTSLTVLNSIDVYNSGDQILHGAQDGVEHFGLKNVIITSTEAQPADTVITVNMDVVTEQDATMGRPVPSSWQFEWQRDAKGWSLRRIVNVRIADATGDKARAQFPRAK